jgi:osmotically-inducible protein OsmY
MAAQVATALQQSPYIFSDHVTVTAENGVVRVGGVVRDLADLYAIQTRAADRGEGAGGERNRLSTRRGQSGLTWTYVK